MQFNPPVRTQRVFDDVATTMLNEAAAIAHEVKQPLTSILSNGLYCLRQLDRDSADVDQIRAAVRDIVDDAGRAISIISQIRALLMRQPPALTRLDLNDVVREVVRYLQGQIDRNRINVMLNLEGNLPRVVVSKEQLHQAFANVLVNSIDALQSAPDPNRRIWIASRESPEGIVVEVRDFGPGFDPQTAERLFEPSYTTKSEGMGLGLSISRFIMDAHGGRLTNRPAFDGAIFEFIFPVLVDRA